MKSLQPDSDPLPCGRADCATGPEGEEPGSSTEERCERSSGGEPGPCASWETRNRGRACARDGAEVDVCERSARLFRFARGLGPGPGPAGERRWARRPAAPPRLIMPRHRRSVYIHLAAARASQRTHGALLAGGLDRTSGLQLPLFLAKRPAFGAGQGQRGVPASRRPAPAHGAGRMGRENRPAEPASLFLLP